MLKKLTLSLLLCITFALSSQAITINGKKVNFDASEIEEVTVTFDQPNVIGITLEINGEDIKVETLISEKVSLAETNQYFNTIKEAARSNQIFRKIGKIVTAEFEENFECVDGWVMDGIDNITVSAGKKITAKTGIITCQKGPITLKSSMFNLDELFVCTPKSITFAGLETHIFSQSWLESITFDTPISAEKSFSFGFGGTLDFKNPSNTQKFIALGTNQISFRLIDPTVLIK